MSARGSMILLVGQVITAVISTLTIIWMARVLGSTAYGEYTIALLPVSIALLFQDFGVNMSLTRFCALLRHEDRIGELRTVVMTGLVFSIITSLVISLGMYALAAPISEGFLKRPELTSLIQTAALAVFGGGSLTTIQAILVGYEMMKLRSFTQILWSIMRTIFTLALLLIGSGAYGAVLANTVSLLAVGLFVVTLNFFVIKFESEGLGFSWSMLRGFLSYGLPMSASSLLGGTLTQIYSSVMVILVSTDLVGNFSAASNFGVPISFLTIPITTTLFPLFSKFDRNDIKIAVVTRQAARYTAMLTLPLVMVIIALAQPLSHLIYGGSYPHVAEFLSLYILTFAFEGMGGLSLSNAISGVGESKVILISTAFTFITGLAMVFILGPLYGMMGILATMVIAPRAGWAYQIIWARKKMGLNMDWLSTVKIYMSAVLACVATVLLVRGLNLYEAKALVAGGLIYFTLYVISLPLSGALRNSDVVTLSGLADEMGFFGQLANLFLSFLLRFTRE